MQKLLKWSHIADYIVAAVLAVLSVYFLVKHDYPLAGATALTSVVSFVFAKAALARRVATRVMLARLSN